MGSSLGYRFDRRYGSRSYRPLFSPHNAFTLPEVLVSSVILVVAIVGSIAASNLVIQSVRGTGVNANQNRRIDQDIAEISRLSEEYNACVDPLGSTNVNCVGQDVQFGNSFYYFPNPQVQADVAAFYDACNNPNDASHITRRFILAINALPNPNADNVQRQNAVRVNGADPNNHLVQITWRDPARNRDLRTFQIRPLVSAWCP